MSDTKNDSVGVLIVDDSALMRNVVGKIVESAEGLHVTGKAINGAFALRKLETLQPDVIVLDLEMPEMNGIEFLKERKVRGISIPVVILSSVARRGARVTMEALSLGASDFILKPSGTNANELSEVSDQIVQTLRAYGRRYRDKGVGAAPVSPAETDRRRTPTAASVVRDVAAKTRSIDIVAIGISTGGPNALRRVFGGLDAALSVPVVVVQHMPAGFTAEFAESLDRISPLSVKEAEEGDVLAAGRAFVAPGNFHMRVERRRLATTVTLNQNEPVNGHRPSVDVLLSSVLEAYGNRTLAVIMTGMGKDGARVLGEIHDAGGLTLAQDEETSVVYGMPRVAFENGAVDRQVGLPDMAAVINELVASHQK